jgi:hypothetical protein
MRRHLTFANVASATALALVLGGGVAVAAGLGPNSVGSAQIKKNAVKSSEVKNNSLKGKDVKESTLGSVPRVDTVVTTPRVTAAPGAVPSTVATRGPFTITLRCVDAGGGVMQSFLEIRTSVNDAAYDARAAFGDGDWYPEFDVVNGPQVLAQTSDNNPTIQRAAFVATEPGGRMHQAIGYTSHRINGSTGCAAQLTFLG